MKLWILRPIDTESKESHWVPWCEKAFGFVICARTELQARALADNDAGDENANGHPWMEPAHSTCVELVAGDKPAIIMSDVWSA